MGYGIVAAALRNDGTGWQPITEAGHKPVGVDSVSTLPASVTVHFDGLEATGIGTFIAAPDEALARAGYTFGASVGLGKAIIQGSRAGEPIDFTTLTTAKYPYSNIWIYGLFHTEEGT